MSNFGAGLDVVVRNRRSSAVVGSANPAKDATTKTAKSTKTNRLPGGKRNHVTDATAVAINVIQQILSDKYLQVPFTVTELLGHIPAKMRGTWANPNLELNRILNRVMKLPIIGKQEHGRGRRPNLYYYSGQNTLIGRVPQEAPTPKAMAVPIGSATLSGFATDNMRDGRGRNKGAAARKVQVAPVQQVQQVQPDTNQPSFAVDQTSSQPPVSQVPQVQQLAVVQSTPASASTYGTSGAAKASQIEVHTFGGVQYTLGTGIYERRVRGNPKDRNRLVPAIYNLSTKEFVLDSKGELLILPAKTAM